MPHYLAFAQMMNVWYSWWVISVKLTYQGLALAGPLDAGSSGLRLWLGFAVQIERYCSANQVLQRSLIDLLAFVDVDGAPYIPVEAGVE